MAISADRLKRKLKAAGEETDEAWRTRLHRAISWLRRAHAEERDLDARYIFLWIAFNAAYAREMGHDEPERERLRLFVERIIDLDHEGRLRELVFSQFSGAIRVLLGNRYVFEPFWRALREHDASPAWEEKFNASQRAATAAVVRGDTAQVLSIVFDRLYVLRNQLVHGGATWNSRVNRAQLRDGVAILDQLVPLVIELMLEHPETGFGDVLYPPV